MKAIIDDKIPYIRPFISKLVDEAVFLPGAEITAQDVRDADILIVRTRTRCNRSLLHGSRVRFIATATIGYDHLDTAYLQQAGIRWTNCPGCNASSVGQYIHSCMLVLARETGLALQTTTVGIVGAGHVGTDVQKKLSSLGMKCLICDPPREQKEGNARGQFHSLQELMEQCQVITFHTPLVTEGPWPTLHMANASFFSALKQRPVIINTSRGEVVDNDALEKALADGLVRQAVIDTWEGEPRISRSLLEKVFIGTPHIAGYSADGKANATQMVLTALCEWMGFQADFKVEPPSLPETFIPSADSLTLALQLYDPRTDSSRLKACPEDFERIRNNYPLRRESASWLQH